MSSLVLIQEAPSTIGKSSARTSLRAIGAHHRSSFASTTDCRSSGSSMALPSALDAAKAAAEDVANGAKHKQGQDYLYKEQNVIDEEGVEWELEAMDSDAESYAGHVDLSHMLPR